MPSATLARALRRTALITVAAATLTPAAAAAAPPPIFGYGDQHPVMFADARWQALPLRDVRRTVDWDTPSDPVKTAALDTWMGAAQGAQARPLLAIDRTWTAGREKTKPTIKQYRALITWLRSRYPWWNQLTPWNEANFRLQPTAKNPALAFRYWQAAKAACKGCTVTSPVVLAGKGTNSRWLPAFRKLAKGRIRLWAVHVYADQNRNTDKNLRSFERQLPGKLWVTEAAGWVKFLDTKRWPYNEDRAARAVRFTFKTARKHRGRVQRWYFYQWQAGADPKARWDSGVLNSDGTERPGYQALVAGLRASGSTR